MTNKFIFFLSLMFLATGCSAENKDVTGTANVNDITRITKAPIVHKETIGDLAYEIRFAKNEYGMNDDIEVEAKVTNIGKKTLIYVSGSSSCPTHVGLEVINKEDSNMRLALKPSDEPCTADLGHSELAPGETIESNWIFIEKYYVNNKLVPADPGTHVIKAALPPEDIDITEDDNTKPISARPSVTREIVLSK
jgi:hypothetical protein